MLSIGQQGVIAAVLNAPDSIYAKSGDANRDELYGIVPVRDYLYFALPGGVLTLFFANPRYPTAEYPLNWPNCPPVMGGSDCRSPVHIVGSGQLGYYPACRGGPGNTPIDGQRLAPIVSGLKEELDPIDILARKAYQRNGVATPWSQTNEFWEKAAAKQT